MQFLLLRTNKILSDQFPKILPERGPLFSYFIFFSPNTFFFKETEYGERCSVKNSTNYKQQFILTKSFCFLEKGKILWITFRRVQNWSLRILIILKQNVHNQHKLYIVDRTAFHTASSGRVCFKTEFCKG